MIASDEEQQAAFQRYTEARAKVEASLSFEDGRAAAQAWVDFLDAFIPDDRKLPAAQRGQVSQ